MTRFSSNSVLEEQRRRLPISKGKEALLREIQNNDVTILLGETGSGKTTQVPQYILESGISGSGTIAITQPRRVAAISLATRVAAETRSVVGKLIGYSVRFDERSTSETRINYMTDGMVVRELLSDPLLNRYSVLIIDEAHERTVRTDLLMANLKRIQMERNKPRDTNGKKQALSDNPLKVVIMSATLDAENFSRFFNNAKVLYIRGRQYPVKIFYSVESQTDYVDSALRTFFQIHIDHPPGDVLIFLTGQEDIETLEKSIKFFANQLPEGEMEVLACSMYAAQTSGQNARVFVPAPPNTRKCILSTNIAETSITIPGVKYVIDTGLCKEKRYLARNTGGGFDALLTRAITKTSALQRAGRAGREVIDPELPGSFSDTAPEGEGLCFRLYTEDAYNKMELTPEPEILRCSLTSSILQLKCLSQDLEDTELIDAPDWGSIASALKSLWLLDAINPNKELTSLGRQMAGFPLEPAYARSIIASKEYGCALEVIDIVSVLSASSKLFVDIMEYRDAATEARKIFHHISGDHLTILNALRAYEETVVQEDRLTRREWCKKHFMNERTLLEAAQIRNQLRQVCTRLQIDWTVSCGDRKELVLKSLAHGLMQNSAFLQPDGSYKQIMEQSPVKIHPGSVLYEKKVPAIIYDELVFTSQIFARSVSSVSKSVFANLGALDWR